MNHWLMNALCRYRMPCRTEAVLQDSIEQVLVKEGLSYQREAPLNEQDRPDFLVKDLVGVVAVEVKVAGRTSSVLRQIHRYARHESVMCILVVTTRALHLRLPGLIEGKHVDVLYIADSAL